MPYKLYEYTGNDQMSGIWDTVWAEQGFEKKVKDIENDMECPPIFLKYLPKNGKTLEGGCGYGQWVVRLKNFGYDVIGIDFAKNTIDFMKKYHKDIPVEFDDINNTRFTDNYFDAYISLGVVEHSIEGPFSALSEARRILKRDGLLLISVPVFNSVRQVTIHLENLYNGLRENKLIRKIFGKNEYPAKNFVEYRYRINEFEEILKKESFVVVEKFPILHSPLSLFNHFLEPPSSLKKGKLAYKISEKISKVLKNRSKWIAPHLVMWVCRNEGMQ